MELSDTLNTLASVGVLVAIGVVVMFARWVWKRMEKILEDPEEKSKLGGS